MLALLLVLLTAPAQATNGAGGVIVHAVSLDRDAPDANAAGPMQCVGAIGFGVRDTGARLGAEAHGCEGPRADMGFAGLQLGRQRHYGRIYAGWTAGLGAGGLSVVDDTGRIASSAFGYLRPGIHAGLPLGFLAGEVGVYAMIPLVHVYGQKVNPVEKSNLGHVGVQATFLFGNLRRPRPAPPEPPRVAHAPPPRQVVVAESAPPPPPGDGRPLAITEPDHPAPLE